MYSLKKVSLQYNNYNGYTTITEERLEKRAFEGTNIEERGKKER